MREDRQKTLDLLHEAVNEWALTPAGWRTVDDVLGRLSAAVIEHDEDGIRSTLSDLIYAGPRRARSGATPPTSGSDRVPERIRERIDVIIHQIGDPLQDLPAEDVGTGAAG